MNNEPVSHDEIVKKLFLEMTSPTEDNELRTISFTTFKKIIDNMMDKAYYYGLSHASTQNI
jgi:hypothetical protein